MTTISNIFKKYSGKLDYLDLELLIAHAIGKSREFVMANPEEPVISYQLSVIKKYLKRRINGEPIAHILGHREFFGLDFEVNKHTLIPRPETEQLVELAIENLLTTHYPLQTVIDVGTGSGNIIVSIAKTMENSKLQIPNYKFIGIDLSSDALKVAKRNAKRHGVDKKIKFLHGDLLSPFLENLKSNLAYRQAGVNGQMSIVITANLPYLSKEIFDSAPIDVKKFEPKSALYSSKKGLAHYEKLFKQIEKLFVTCHLSHVTCYLEYSPEQKKNLQELIKIIFPKSKTSFHKDLANKWRIAEIKIS